MKLIVLFFSIAIISFNSLAQISSSRKKGGAKMLKGGSYALGFAVGFGSIEQSGMNQAIRSAKALSAATTGEINSAMEYIGFLSFKFPTYPITIQFRPSYFLQSSTGTGTGGSYNYDITGYTFFPLVRFIALNNDIIDFYLQGGLGYATLNGKITNAARNVSFSGSGFGMQAGIGADFCFFPEHCIGIEGSYRYLPIVRNVNTAGTTTAPDGVSTALSGRELENAAGEDIPTYLTGVTGIISYTFNF